MSSHENHNHKFKFKVYSAEHCSYCTKKTKYQEKKEKTDRSSVWIWMLVVFSTTWKQRVRDAAAGKVRSPMVRRRVKSFFCSTDANSCYLRQVNEVNGGDNAFVRCVSVCVCVCVCGRSWELNANSSKTVKATDFKFDTHVPSDSPDMITKNFPKRGRGHGHVTP